MLVLPIPMIVCLLLAFLLVRTLLIGHQPRLLLMLIGLCALQSLIISLVRYYEITALLPLQPIAASLIPPVAWLAFSSTRHLPELKTSDLWHAAGPVLAVLLLLLAGDLLDALLPLLYAGYGIAILMVVSRGEGYMPEIRLESGNIPARLWQLFAITLIASAFSDIIIVVTQILGHDQWLPIIISLFSSLNLLLIGMISLSRELSRHNTEPETPEPEAEQVTTTDQADTRYDQDIMDQLEVLLEKQQLFLDPDLTLAKLARKLSIPAKQLSATINRSQGENISRYINRFRIEHACSLLEQGKSITATVYESGFNTRSNFNREFQRLKSMNPSNWITVQKPTAPPPSSYQSE